MRPGIPWLVRCRNGACMACSWWKLRRRVCEGQQLGEGRECVLAVERSPPGQSKGPEGGTGKWMVGWSILDGKDVGRDA